MASILVTGGTGFIGSHTATALVKAGYNVLIVDNLSNSEAQINERIGELAGQNILFRQTDCTDADALDHVFAQNSDIEGVIHFAAFKSVSESVAEPLKYYHNNLESTNVLLSTMNRYGVKNLVFSSSCTVYGQPGTIPVTEQTPVGHIGSPYGFTKLACEQMIQDFSVAHPGIQGAILRYFNPIGAHPSGKLGELPLGRPNNLVPYIMQTAAGLQDELVVFGNDYSTPDGTCIRDFIHVMDLADAHIKALQWLENGGAKTPAVFNVGRGTGQSVLGLIETFQEATGEKLNWRYGPRRAGDIPDIYADVSKARDVLGWAAKYTSEDALIDAWRWQKNLGPNG